MDSVDLNRPGETRESAIERIRAAAASGRSGWTIATGWNSGRFALDKADFDGLSPIVVLSLSIHGLIVNDAGRLLLREHDETVAAHLDDQDWIERNLRRVLNVFARAGASAERLKTFFDRLREIGLHSAEEMLLVGEEEIQMFDNAGLASRTQFWAAPETYDSASPANRERIHGIKLFTDGAIGVTTAALHEKYRTADHQGILLYSDDALEDLIATLCRQKPMAIHAIGDAAIDQVVSAVERAARARPAAPGDSHRARAVHFRIDGATREGAWACTSQCSRTSPRIPSCMRIVCRPAIPPRNNPFRMLIDRIGYVPGIDLYLGSDGMPHGVHEALRQSLFPDGGYEGQVLTLDEFIAGYCCPDMSQGSIDIEVDPVSRSVHCCVK